jgi:hypothetical protein
MARMEPLWGSFVTVFEKFSPVAKLGRDVILQSASPLHAVPYETVTK